MTFDLKDDFATDIAKEEEGILEPYNEHASFLIARTHNKKFDKHITALVNKNRRLLDSKSEAATAKSEEIMIDTMARTILIGWEGEFNFGGKPMGEYSVEKAKQLLAIKDFRAWVQAVSEDFGRFKAKQDEDDAGK